MNQHSAAEEAAKLSRFRLRLLLKQNGIGPTEIARSLRMRTHTGVSNWFRKRNESTTIEAEVRRRAAEILANAPEE